MPTAIHHSTELSESARRRWSQHERQPLLLSDWLEAVFIHYEIDAQLLQRAVPFELDQWEGKAWVSAVSFTMRRLRFARGGKFSEWLCRPAATQHFLNLRTYVRDRGEPGIYFLAEWLSSALSVCLGPPLYGLPYRHGRLDYQNAPEPGILRGRVTAGRGAFAYAGMTGDQPEDLAPCEPGTLDEFLLERYTAYTCHAGRRRLFRIWHEPWQQRRIELERLDESLLAQSMPWWPEARFVGANYSPGVRDIWMGRPRG